MTLPQNRQRFLRFLVPSLAGILIFLTPVSIDGNHTILLGVLTNLIRSLFASIQLPVIVGVICLSALGGLYHTVFRPNWETRFPALHAACQVPRIWLALRMVSAMVGLMLVFNTGPDLLLAPDAGPFIYTEGGGAVLYILFVAMFLMPLLTDFGFMDFVGTLLQRPFKVLFRLPGNAAVDATASFVSASTVAMMVTLRQYERNVYTAREAVSIAANFSIVSIPYCLFIADFTGFGHMFFTWYLTVVCVCLILAIITVRLPPLTRIAPDYLDPGAGPPGISETSEQPLLKRALEAAMARAAGADTALDILKTAWVKAVGLVANVLGPSMLIGTLTILVIRNTEVFNVISYPIALILGWLNVPESTLAAPGFLVGFLDMFMPAAVASSIDSEFTRFVLAGVAVSQIIYMSDLGVIILRSKLPVGFLHLLGIFVIRTIFLIPLFFVAASVVL